MDKEIKLIEFIAPYHTHAELCPPESIVYREKDVIEICKKLTEEILTLVAENAKIETTRLLNNIPVDKDEGKSFKIFTDRNDIDKFEINKKSIMDVLKQIKDE